MTTGTFRMRRSRGVFSGFLLILLGAWGALIPFIGPYFHYAYTPDVTWTYTSARLLLEILPGAATFLGGFILLFTAARHIGMFGALLAAASGAWFVLGGLFSPLWNHNAVLGGHPASATVVMKIAEQVGFFTGLGVVIVFLASVAFGKLLAVDDAARLAPAETETTEAYPTQPIG